MADAVQQLTGDMLDAARINGLPQPLLVRLRRTWWPVHDIEPRIGLMRIDVCGRLEVRSFAEAMEIEDSAGGRHDPDVFWTESAHA